MEILHARRKQAIDKGQDTVQLESLIEDIKENINYVQETISETQRNVMDIEETEDSGETNRIQKTIDSLLDITEGKYLIEKLFGMTLSQSHAVAQRDAKLKESEATIAEVSQKK